MDADCSKVSPLTTSNMKSILCLCAVGAALAAFPLCSCAGPVDNTPVASLDLSRYLGTWYEIARFNHSFERGMTDVTAEYLLRRRQGRCHQLRMEGRPDENSTRKGKTAEADNGARSSQSLVLPFLLFRLPGPDARRRLQSCDRRKFKRQIPVDSLQNPVHHAGDLRKGDSGSGKKRLRHIEADLG